MGGKNPIIITQIPFYFPIVLVSADLSLHFSLLDNASKNSFSWEMKTRSWRKTLPMFFSYSEKTFLLNRAFPRPSDMGIKLEFASSLDDMSFPRHPLQPRCDCFTPQLTLRKSHPEPPSGSWRALPQPSFQCRLRGVEGPQTRPEASHSSRLSPR